MRAQPPRRPGCGCEAAAHRLGDQALYQALGRALPLDGARRPSGDGAEVTAEEGSAAPAARRSRQDRRSTPDRRYNSRQVPESDTTPPYFEVFQRIASALEGIERALLDGGAPGHPAGPLSDQV